MAKKTLNQELLELEKQYWQAIKDKDVDAAMDLTDETCIVAGASGVAKLDRGSLAKMMQSASYTLHDFSFDDAQVRKLSNDVAILAYKVHEELTVDGKSIELDAADCSTWIKRDGHWLCALHSESIVGDPFGRDRTKSAAKPS